MRDGDLAPAREAGAARWTTLVDTALPLAWTTAQAQNLSIEDAALVCEATLLTLLDRVETTNFTAHAGDWAIAQFARRVALVECRRTQRLKTLRTPEPVINVT